MGNAALKIVNKTNDSIQAQAAAARARIEEFKALIKEAEATAQSAEAKADNEPNEATVVSSIVAQKTLAKLKREWKEYQMSVAAIITAADQEAHRAEFDQLQGKLHLDLERKKEALRSFLAETKRQLRGKLLELREAVVAENAQRDRAQYLAESLGLQQRFPPANVDNIITNLVPPEPYGSGPLPLLLSSSGDDGYGQHWARVEINEPI